MHLVFPETSHWPTFCRW